MRQFTPSILCAIAATAVLSASPAAANSDGFVTYDIRPNDTLFNIADRYLVNRQAARQVQRINGIRNERRLRINTQIQIPRRLLDSKPVTLTVKELAGSVRIAGAAASTGQILQVGQVVETGADGFVTFTTSYGGVISLPTNTTAQLQTAKRYTLGNALDVDFRLRRGRVNTSSPPLSPQDRLQMSTPLAVTAVRGTTFRIGFDPENGDASLTEVAEGAVNVAAGGAESEAPAGFGIVSTSSGVLPPEELLPVPAIANISDVQTGEMLEFDLEPVAGATGYRVQIASDLSFSDVIGEQVIEGETASFPSVDNGKYAVRARAIAQSGLEGLSEVNGFTRKRLGVTGNADALSDLGGYRFDWSSQGSNNARFAFQLWEEGKPGAPLIDELGLSVTELSLINLDAGRYEWRVGALETDAEAGLIKVWGAPQTLVIPD